MGQPNLVGEISARRRWSPSVKANVKGLRTFDENHAEHQKVANTIRTAVPEVLSNGFVVVQFQSQEIACQCVQIYEACLGCHF